MEKYQRGKIYAIICRKTGRRYIGSTCEPTLAKRLAQHVTDFKNCCKENKLLSSFDIIKDGDYYIVLLELYPCNSRDELRMAEQKHIDTCECINKIKAFISNEDKQIDKQIYSKDYYKQNRNKLLEYKKHYEEKNRNKISEYQIQYYYKNREKKIEQMKQYGEKNRDKISEKKKEKYECPCGLIICKSSKSSHEKSKNHILFMSSV